MHPALFYLPGDRLTLAELSAARLDGDVVDIGEGYMPADTAEGPDARATALASLVPAHVAACGPTAAWIHGARDAPPHPHHLQRAVERRMRPPSGSRLVFHDTPLPASDLVMIGGISVTTPLRTLIDLAKGIQRDDALQPWAIALAQLRPDLVSVARSEISRRERLPGRRLALALLDGLAATGQEEVTRYTS